MKKAKINKVVILGGLGFIGRYLSYALLKKGYSVTVIDKNVTSKIIKNASNIKNLKIVSGDVLDKKSLKIVLPRKNVIIFNLAGHSGVKSSFENPELNMNLNIFGPLNVLELAKEIVNCRVIFVGSRLEYGKVNKFPVSEAEKTEPLSPYAINKFTAGRYHNLYYKLYGVQTVVFRGTNPYGPTSVRENNNYNIISSFIDTAKSGKIINIYKESRNEMKDYIYIQDFCDALLASMHNNKVLGKTLNLGFGRGTKFLDAANTISKLVQNSRVSLSSAPSNFDKINGGSFVADIKTAKKLLKWHPRLNFNDGVKQTLLELENKDSLLYKLLAI